MILNADIVHQICTYLRPVYIKARWNVGFQESNLELRTLRNISLASKACAEIARPSLWHAVVIAKEGLDRLPSLIDRIVDRPELSRLIREVHFEALWDGEYELLSGQDMKMSASKRTPELISGLALPATVEERLHKAI